MNKNRHRIYGPRPIRSHKFAPNGHFPQFYSENGPQKRGNILCTISIFYAFQILFLQSEGVEKEGCENLTNDTPPKKGFGTPPRMVWFPPRSGVSALFFLYKNPRESRPEALLDGSKNFRERALSGTFSSPIRFTAPPITAQKIGTEYLKRVKSLSLQRPWAISDNPVDMFSTLCHHSMFLNCPIQKTREGWNCLFQKTPRTEAGDKVQVSFAIPGV